jgi:hypothetical protein
MGNFADDEQKRRAIPTITVKTHNRQIKKTIALCSFAHGIDPGLTRPGR